MSKDFAALLRDVERYREDPRFEPYFREPRDEAERQGLLDRVGVRQGVRSGQPIIRGMRITVRDVLEWAGVGVTPAELIVEWPWMESDDVRAALLFARASIVDVPADM